MAVRHSYCSVIHLLYTILITDERNSDKGAFSNLKTEHYGDFADFLATCAKHFVDEGYNLLILVRLTNRSITGMAMNKKVRPGRIQKWQR